ncbi:hypothetical protein HB662_25975 [Roseomonas frigidaquae]|uniref:Uncharacterized protein n=1 Tax=Falsiroseomonas frigidaquae TaxID=487318 RepID=A0ABX1F793_9PROT|nr:hypothetical protein [Falsiroseomonas frigidaquae]NKE48251.1 hypothetical protein [Falsiroseomonas frigidaquae]
MNRRGLLAAGLALLAPGTALAQRRGAAQVLPYPPPPAPPLPGMIRPPLVVGDLAPMPNRNIQAPPDIYGDQVGPRLEPMIIDEREQRRGFTFGREHLSDRQDVLLKDLAPGARLRIPLD